MSLFAIDSSTFELRRETGGFVRITGLEEVRQGCHHRANLIRTEARFAADKGVPHFEGPNGEPALFTKGLPEGIAEQMIHAEISDVAGVVGVDFVRLNQDATAEGLRQAWIDYAARVSLDKLRADVRISETVELRTP